VIESLFSTSKAQGKKEYDKENTEKRKGEVKQKETDNEERHGKKEINR